MTSDLDMSAGEWMHELARELWPINRSITGEGVRQTLDVLRRELPGLRIEAVPSGTEVFDWIVPDEWTLREAYVVGPDGERVIDSADSNLHVVGYSEPVNVELSLDELQEHLYSLPEQPDAIPYVTSYYRRRWGFCCTQRQRDALKPGRYRAVVDATLAPGVLNYGELVLPGRSPRELFISTYVCHPSMANNELSGPVVATRLAKWVAEQAARRYTCRFVFIPETIGSITYLSRNLRHLREHVVAGFNLTCIGDDRAYSYLPSRAGDTPADRAALHVLRHHAPDFVRYSFLDRGSDERQYCAPGVDLPVASLMRTKYARYPEYHTSLDDLTVVTPRGLAGGYQVAKTCLHCLENNRTWRNTVLCEPQLGKRGLYPTLGARTNVAEVALIRDLLAYCDGTRDLLAVADAIGQPMPDCIAAAHRLQKEGLLEEVGCR